MTDSVHKQREWIQCPGQSRYPPNARTDGIHWNGNERIGALYRIEEHIRGKPPEERARVRQAQAVPLLDDMKRWFKATLLTLSAKSDTTKTIQYPLNR